MSESKLTDEYLAEAAQNGDAMAEEMLMRRYKSVVRSKARLYFITGADEEDVVQEGMIGLFKAVSQYRTDRKASFATFASLCITRQIISAIRSADRKKHEILNSSLSLSNPVGDDGENLVLGDIVQSGDADNPETLLVVNDIIDYLKNSGTDIISPFEMEVFQGLLDGQDRDTIAANLGRNRKSIDNAMSRLRVKVTNFICE